jgi:ribosomal protein L12E/L44/L45/RPP1/RPP2
MAKSAGSRLQWKKHHRLNPNSSSQTSSLSSASHGECFMAKGMKKKKPKKVESKEEEEEEEEEENDFDFDKLSKKDMIKIKNLFERLQEQELLLEQ